MFKYSERPATAEELLQNADPYTRFPCEVVSYKGKNNSHRYKALVTVSKDSDTVVIEHKCGTARRKLSELNKTYEIHPWVNDEVAVAEQFECMAEHCIFNPKGFCLYPLISGKKVEEFWSEDGCDVSVPPIGGDYL